MFYLTTHSKHFIYGYYGVGHMVEDDSNSERGNPLPPQYGLIFSSILLAARVLFYPPSDIRDRSPLLIIFPLFSIV